MIILDGQYYIDNTDGLNYTLCKRTKAKSEKNRDKVIGYFGRMDSALNRYAQVVFGEENKTKDFTLKDAVERLKQIYLDAERMTSIGFKERSSRMEHFNS